MLYILGFMAAGILIGFFFSAQRFGKRFLGISSKLQTGSTCVLLFALGAGLGGNAEFWSNLRLLGLQGFLLGIAVCAGSVAVVSFLCKILLRKAAKD